MSCIPTRFAGTVLIINALAAGPALAAPVLPAFNASEFAPGAAIDNRYFSLKQGVTYTYAGEVDGVQERFELKGIGRGPKILGVQTSTQRDRAFEGDRLVEETFDYYAQDRIGNVWYFGEDVTNFVYDDNDNLIDTNSASSWRAGVNSGLPGFIMQAEPEPGSHYYQEFSPFDAAIDEGQVLGTDRTLSLGIGEFSDVLAILETLATDPQARGIKYYAPGMGLIAEDEGVALDFMSAEARLELVSVSAVPVPAALPLLLSAVGLVLVRRRRTRSPA